MKNVLLIALIILQTVYGWAQDMLITKDADTVECKITGITDDFIMFQVYDSEKTSKVPVDALHKYLFRMEWETVGALNQNAFEKKKISVEKEFVGNVRTAGFRIQRAARYQMLTPIFGLAGIGFSIGGGLQLSNNQVGNRAMIATGIIFGAASITSQILSAMELRKAGVEFEFVPIKYTEGTDESIK